TVWVTPEPENAAPPARLPGDTAARRIKAWLAGAVVAPFADLYRRAGAKQLVAIAVFIVLYKFGDALAGSMANPLYVALGFTKVEVATISKVYGVAATLAGVALGGALVARIGPFRALFVGGGLQALSNLMYAAQVWAGHDVAVLTFTIGGENLTGGMASAAFVAYLSLLCSRDFTATQYALLSSLATVGLNVLAASGGALADWLGWVPFFVVSTAACLPSLALLLWIMRRPIAAAQP
ncbi:MAG TPA: MFS transporter, partial [Stellaceae bacterium]|nr:MFS transporter [Stellaceae bacterium]